MRIASCDVLSVTTEQDRELINDESSSVEVDAINGPKARRPGSDDNEIGGPPRHRGGVAKDLLLRMMFGRIALDVSCSVAGRSRIGARSAL
jgi:hypothetical protein